MHIFKHFITITKHRHMVMRYCFKIGLIKQGLLHDLSKYSPIEFFNGAKYYEGTRSPHHRERDDKGYSEAWMHHKGRNKHHYEYWFDYTCDPDKKHMIVPVPMPDKYIAEMIMDRIAASKVYQGENYNDSCPLAYYNPDKPHDSIHPETAEKLERMLRMLAEEGEEKTFACIKNELVKHKNSK